MTRSELEQLDALPVLPGQRPDPAVRAPDPARHRLVVDGLVTRRLELTAADLAELPQADVTEDFVCREGWCVPGLHWEGVALATVLDAAGMDAATQSVQVSSGDYSSPLTREQAEHSLLALRLGGEPLTVEHGAPVRLIVPGADCYTSIKWLERIEARLEPDADTAQRTALARIWS